MKLHRSSPIQRPRIIRGKFSFRDDLKGLNGTLTIQAILKSKLHIGSGKMKLSYKFDLDVNKMAKSMKLDFQEFIKYSYVNENGKVIRKPVIPGSTLKGLSRSRLELSFTGRSIPSCFAVSSRLTRMPRAGGHGWRHVRIWSPATLTNRDRQCSAVKRKLNEINLCKICDLFGAPGVVSRIYFGNLVLEGNVNDYIEELSLDFGEKLEVIRENAKFTGEISFHSINSVDLGLICISLKLHEDEPVLLGRSKYRARHALNGRRILLGRVNFKPLSFTFAPYSLNEARKLVESLNIAYEVVDGNKLQVTGDNAFNFAKMLAKIAFDEFPQLRNVNEVREVEKLASGYG
ncbi:MAG: RAMP superfamily CRISPR-associated protein [archaeon GB-1867-035]|nr:RAMP superfamily CRISPR-associated protein [Candidatus Culexmicrobium profundum]